MKRSIVFILLAVVVFSCSNNNQETLDKSSSFNINNIDSTISPCIDFYLFAAGNWIKNNPIPESESRWMSFNLLHKANQKKIQEIISAPKNTDQKVSENIQKIGNFYTSYMDTTTLNKLKLLPIIPFLTQIDAATSFDTLVTLSLNFQKIGYNTLFNHYVMQDVKKSDTHTLYASTISIGLPDRSYYFPKDKKGEKTLLAYKTHIETLFFEYFNDTIPSKSAANDVLKIEKIFAMNMLTLTEKREPKNRYNPVAIKDMNSKFPFLNWDHYFKKINVENRDSIILSDIKFYQQFHDDSRKVSLDNWKNYLKFQIINQSAKNLHTDIQQKSFNFYGTTLSGTKKRKPLSERATAKTSYMLGELIGEEFVKKHFSEKSKVVVENMVENIASTFEDRLSTLKWMTDSTKQKALRKLNTYTYKIGYPNKWEDYSNIVIENNQLIKNIFSIEAHGYQKMMEKLSEVVNRDEWHIHPHQVNAYYSPINNEVVFPAGILQPPFYFADGDKAVNYGSIGAVIGHEFSHGFDDKGSKFNHEGNLSNWWSDVDRKKFEERTNKLVKQFNNFLVIDNIYVNGELTLGENIADIAGLTLAYYAMENALSAQEKSEKIDGFTYKQRFFLGWAQVWQGVANDQEKRRLAIVDPHSPSHYRVIGPLINMPEFWEAFDCKKGSPMVASDSAKVTIW